MGRIDPVECIGVSQQRNGNVLNVKPPAIRVRDDCYTKITFPFIIEVFRPLSEKGKVILWQSKRIRSHIRNGCVNITSSSPQSIDEKLSNNQYKTDLRDIIKQLCSYKGVEIIQGHLMPDHVHMLVSIPPKISVSSFMGYLKGKSALMMFDRHANLKYKFGNRYFWSKGYYVSTVGLNEATIKKYIQDQEKADIMQDKFRVKEYEDPFKSQG